VYIKYRDKTYSSIDLPIFIYFKTDKNRNDFINLLQFYELGTWCRVNCMYFVLAGKTVIKDKRSLFDTNDADNNAMMCAPDDIDEDTLLKWVQNHLEKLD